MIFFRCWYCGRTFAVADERKGERRECTCGRRLRVPSRSGGSSRARTAADWLIEIVVYGGGGALLGFGLGLMLVAAAPPYVLGLRRRVLILAGLTLFGLLVGTFGGEAGVNWIGRMIREREQR
jgi:hypothetical protein